MLCRSREFASDAVNVDCPVRYCPHHFPQWFQSTPTSSMSLGGSAAPDSHPRTSHFALNYFPVNYTHITLAVEGIHGILRVFCMIALNIMPFD